MPLRPPAGYIRLGYDPLKVPNAPTIGTAVASGATSVSVAFTPPANVGGSPVSAYYAVSNPGQVTATGASSPISVSGLSEGTPYTFTVWALNTYGPSPYSAASNSTTPAVFGYFGGGTLGGSSAQSTVSRVQISTTGNASGFASLSPAVYYTAACSNSTRGLWTAGRDQDAINIRTIQYITLATGGGALTFGNLDSDIIQTADCANSTRGVIAGGSGAPTSRIEYVTIATTGNAINFGNLTVARYGAAGSGSSTRGLFNGGSAGSDVANNTIDFITIASTGNATDFGDLTVARLDTSAASNDTRSLTICGRNAGGRLNVIDYVTIASTGNAIDFGDATVSVQYTAACASSTRALRGGGEPSTNVIDYVTIASTGNATDFGDLTLQVLGLGACSNGHGGL